MSAETSLFLSLTQRPSGELEPQRRSAGAHGNCVRCLNTAGRWAVQGTAAAPLLVWPAETASGAQSAPEALEAPAAPSAQAAAAHASAQHGRAVELLSRSDADRLAAGPLQCFTEAFASALTGPAPQSEGKTRRLRTEADKLAAYCLVVRAAAAAADQPAFAEVSRAASKALRAKFGGGSITSAFAWLAGGAGRDALQSVLAGEVELTGPLSLGQIVAAAALGQETDMLAERLREKS